MSNCFQGEPVHQKSETGCIVCFSAIGKFVEKLHKPLHQNVQHWCENHKQFKNCVRRGHVCARMVLLTKWLNIIRKRMAGLSPHSFVEAFEKEGFIQQGWNRPDDHFVKWWLQCYLSCCHQSLGSFQPQWDSSSWLADQRLSALPFQDQSWHSSFSICITLTRLFSHTQRLLVLKSWTQLIKSILSYYIFDQISSGALDKLFGW